MVGWTGSSESVLTMSSLPILLVQGKGVGDDAIAKLLRSPRVQLFRAPDLHSSPTKFARHNARATVLATMGDPLRELVFARTSGFTGPLILAIDSRFSRLSQDVLNSGVLGCLTLPITEDELDPVLDLVDAQPAPPVGHAGLDLFLDALDRTVRHGKSVVRLSPREFALLHCLIAKKGRPVTVPEIYDYVWGGARKGESMREIVQVNVSQLRKKLASIGLRDALRTYRDYGYGLGEAS